MGERTKTLWKAVAVVFFLLGCVAALVAMLTVAGGALGDCHCTPKALCQIQVCVAIGALALPVFMFTAVSESRFGRAAEWTIVTVVVYGLWLLMNLSTVLDMCA